MCRAAGCKHRQSHAARGQHPLHVHQDLPIRVSSAQLHVPRQAHPHLQLDGGQGEGGQHLQGGRTGAHNGEGEG